jgi:hypothetical protein
LIRFERAFQTDRDVRVVDPGTSRVFAEAVRSLNRQRANRLQRLDGGRRDLRFFLLDRTHRQLDAGGTLMLFVQQHARHSPHGREPRGVKAYVVARFDKRMAIERVIVSDRVAGMQADDRPVVSHRDLRFAIAAVA